MFKKCLLASLFSLFLFLVVSQQVFASGFQLKTIGSINVTGSTWTEWWYSAANPTFTGTALEGATVTIDIDGTSQTTTATSGNWTFTPSTATAGSHSVTISSGGSSVTFTLNIGDVPTNVGSPTQSGMPVAGIVDQSLLLLLLGGAVFILGIGLIAPEKNN